MTVSTQSNRLEWKSRVEEVVCRAVMRDKNRTWMCLVHMFKKLGSIWLWAHVRRLLLLLVVVQHFQPCCLAGSAACHVQGAVLCVILVVLFHL